MADLADIERAIVSLIAGGLFAAPYQPGAYQPSVALAPWPPATAGAPAPTPSPVVVKLYRGWPEAANLDADLVAGRAHVSAFPEAGVVQNTTRYPPTIGIVQIPAATLSWTIAGTTATLGGAVVLPQNIVLIVDGQAFAYALQPGDTLATAAAAVAAMIAATRTAALAGAAITVPGAHELLGRVGAVSATLQEVRRQMQGFRVSCWCPSPAARDAVAAAVDRAVAGLRDGNGHLTQFFAMADASMARIRFRTGYTNDIPSKDRVWRRDLCYGVEYATTIAGTAPQVIAAGGTIAASPAPPLALAPSITFQV
jgi:hypothetical protein